RQYFSELMQRFGEMCFPARFEHREIAEDGTHVARAIERGDVRVDLVGEGDETDGVLLSIQKIRERGSKKLCVLKLRDFSRVRVVHRCTRIDEYVTLCVRVSAILFDEVTIGAREQAPVEIAQIVAGI